MRIYLFACIFIFAHIGTIAQEFSIILNEQWSFSLGDDALWKQGNFDDSKWNFISTKQYWEEQGFENYDGYAWYRQKKLIPKQWEKEAKINDGLYVKYDYTADVDEVYFNGHWIGRMGEFPPDIKVNYKDPRKFKIPFEIIQFGKENLIAIRVYDKGGNGGIKTENIELSVISPVCDLNLQVKEDTKLILENNENVDFTIIQKDILKKELSFAL